MSVFFLYLSHFCLSFGAVFKPFHISVIYVKNLHQRGHREISQVFSILSRKLLLVVASNIFVSTVFLYLKMLCHPSLHDTNPLSFVLHED